jgi:hypothetical protein
MRRSLSFLAAFSLAAGLAGAADAANQCRDASGKFVKCPAAASSGQCRDASGKFAKCGTPGAMPAGKSDMAKQGGTMAADKSKSATASATNSMASTSKSATSHATNTSAKSKPATTTSKTTKSTKSTNATAPAPH